MKPRPITTLAKRLLESISRLHLNVLSENSLKFVPNLEHHDTFACFFTGLTYESPLVFNGKKLITKFTREGWDGSRTAAFWAASHLKPVVFLRTKNFYLKNFLRKSFSDIVTALQLQNPFESQTVWTRKDPCQPAQWFCCWKTALCSDSHLVLLWITIQRFKSIYSERCPFLLLTSFIPKQLKGENLGYPGWTQQKI